ncbi:unnamed protein product [Prorocentrum cordatum]|uniref:Uncharacterized protein n=1 Tax=Prorocentrum cordatum TaxID=2364126 RepID=A0ABN9SFP5_9DINO|nr:unnamed protein product [Polarella glacialis]
MAQTEGAQDLESGVLASHWLGPESEELTLKSGLLAIRGALGDRGLLDFPRRPNGTPLVVRQGFFERLLKGEATLQNVAAADASAAEPDVKKLGLQQLLAIRCQSLDYHPTGKDLDPKRSFLVLVDQCIMPLLGQRLLGEETKAFSEAHRAIVMRQVVLIYGANRNLIEKGVTLGSDWWLLAVGGTRRYLHLGRCEVTGTTPSGAACCYRSYTARNPRDPRHSRIAKKRKRHKHTPSTHLRFTQLSLLPASCGGRCSS